ncbi:cysteine--tRNA ligase [Desulfococcus sp.]|uniref:cysteine--tRNA ligase n=1 Tax=Desulfococcus sp. TaxID=2025834 RepID=UPI0035946B2E
MRLYNTLTGDKQPFVPSSPGRVGLYVCGPTVYDDAHLGHARGAVFFDVLHRFFKTLGWTVTSVCNYTDIDDKILARAETLGVGYDAVASRFIAAYEADMQHLGVRPPDHAPRATKYIRPMQEMIGRLLQKGHAYRVQDRVYFRVESFPAYGRLSRRCIENMPAVSRVESDPDKSNPHDFLLWKPSEPDAPGWESPWGRGRPGWHIECSAMAQTLLGDRFDIHGGGTDLVFPHHENEIAQSQAVTGKNPARFWVHHGLVDMDGRKMAKSTGRFVTLRTLFDIYPPDAIRLFLLSKHYRHPLDYSPERMAESAAGAERIRRTLARAEQTIGPPDPACRPTAGDWTDFSAALADDLNTPAAGAILFRAVRRMNLGLNSAQQGSLAAGDIRTLRAVRATVLKMSRDVLGIVRTDHLSCIRP